MTDVKCQRRREKSPLWLLKEIGCYSLFFLKKIESYSLKLEKVKFISARQTFLTTKSCFFLQNFQFGSFDFNKLKISLQISTFRIFQRKNSDGDASVYQAKSETLQHLHLCHIGP